MTSREVGGVRHKLLVLHWAWVQQSPNKTEEKQTKVCCFKAMASISDVLLIVNLFLSASVFGFPLHQDIKQTCGYEVGVPCFVLLMCFWSQSYKVDNVCMYSRCMQICTRFQAGFVGIWLTFDADLNAASSISDCVWPDRASSVQALAPVFYLLLCLMCLTDRCWIK